MVVAVQLKLKMEKAQKLKNRVDGLRKKAREARLRKEKQLKKEKAGGVYDDLMQEIAFLRELELDMNITNLLRTVVDFGIEKLLPVPDEALSAAMHVSKARRGRPPLEKPVEGRRIA